MGGTGGESTVPNSLEPEPVMEVKERSEGGCHSALFPIRDRARQCGGGGGWGPPLGVARWSLRGAAALFWPALAVKAERPRRSGFEPIGTQGTRRTLPGLRHEQVRD